MLSPPILFFFLGVLATLLRSDLDIPKSVARLFSLYLLMSIGLYGGYKLSLGTIDAQAISVMGAAVLASFAMPFATYAILRFKLNAEDAAAVAATFGSISAVTFITAVAVLDDAGVGYSGHMVAAMALMESPAIISGVLLARLAAARRAAPAGDDGHFENEVDWSELLRDALLNGAVVLLVGSMVIGYISGEEGWRSIAPLMEEPFKGVLCLFLLDMGLVAARRIGDLKNAGALLVAFGIVGAVVQGMMGVGVAWLLDLGPGDALLLAILFGSASYIAVPAALRLALPQANPSLYIPLALVVTFPFNIVIGIPMYRAVIEAIGIGVAGS